MDAKSRMDERVEAIVASWWKRIEALWQSVKHSATEATLYEGFRDWWKELEGGDPPDPRAWWKAPLPAGRRLVEAWVECEKVDEGYRLALVAYVLPESELDGHVRRRVASWEPVPWTELPSPVRERLIRDGAQSRRWHVVGTARERIIVERS
ncbi:MAG: hypothetical protein NZ898_08280 [Myxococcota bacterium]|nr:hypothetical protein [Myxococcota bacterium]MDW8364018.1 hypothetical protein [Myxococcales bacterium]